MMEGFIARSHSAHFVSLDRANQPGAGGGHGHRTHGHKWKAKVSPKKYEKVLSSRFRKIILVVDVVHSM